MGNNQILESLKSLQKTVTASGEGIKAETMKVWNNIFLLQDEMNLIKKKIAEYQVIMEKFENLSLTCGAIQKQWNNLEQSQLKCHMEISGIPSSEINSKKPITQIAFETLAKYDKSLKITDIKEASRRFRTINRETASVIDVAFASYEVKMRVLKLKMQVDKGQPVKIFVGHSLTQQNRNLFLQARKTARILNLKCYLIDGRTYMKNHEDIRGIQIRTSYDLQKIQSDGFTSYLETRKSTYCKS